MSDTVPSRHGTRVGMLREANEARPRYDSQGTPASMTGSSALLREACRMHRSVSGEQTPARTLGGEIPARSTAWTRSRARSRSVSSSS